MTTERHDETTHTSGRCRRCERHDGKRHVYQWRRSRRHLLRDAHCPTCAAKLHGTSNELRGEVTYHGRPVFKSVHGHILRQGT